MISLAVGGAVVALTGQRFFLLLGLGGVAVTLVTQITSRRAARARQRTAQREFQEASTAGQERLAQVLDAEQRQRRDAAPDPAHLLRIATEPGTRVVELVPPDDDFLDLRIGWADLPSVTADLRGSSGSASAPEALVRDVPVTLALRALGGLGIAGAESLGRGALAWVIGELAVLHSPGDLSLVLLAEDGCDWRWVRWLPHLRPLPGSKALASVGTDRATCAARAAELRDLGRRNGARPPLTPAGPIAVRHARPWSWCSTARTSCWSCRAWPRCCRTGRRWASTRSAGIYDRAQLPRGPASARSWSAPTAVPPTGSGGGKS